MLTGADVEPFQLYTNKQYEHLNIDRQIAVDGEFGAKTFDAGRDLAIAFGVHGEAQEKFERFVISEGTQKLIRGERNRSEQEIAAFARRKDYREQLRRRYSKTAGELAIAKSTHLVGKTESPPGSNKGPIITEMQVFTGYTWVDDPGVTQGVFWCGCCACWIVVKIGGARIPNRIRLGFADYITADALAGANGLTAVPIHRGRAGDIICLFGGKHIAVLREDVKPGDTTVKTREGNTSSSDAGSQDNGGGIFDRVRSISDIDREIAARPNWA